MRYSKILLTALITANAACFRSSPVTEPLPAHDSFPPSVSSADEDYFDRHPLMVPVDGIEPRSLRDTFSEPRDGGRTHRATDILAPRGTPVLAAISGEVVRLSQNAAGGITAWLVDDARHYVYYYAHLDHYSDQLTQGLKVPEGFVIGYVGTSGNAPPDTPHLHFQAMRLREGQRDWWNGIPVDVRQFMIRTGKARE